MRLKSQFIIWQQYLKYILICVSTITADIYRPLKPLYWHSSVGVNECRPPYVPACTHESVRMRARGYWHKDDVSIWQKDACKALWDTLGIKPHFHRSPQKGVHSSFIKKENNNTQPPPLPLLTLPQSLPFCSARPDRPKGLSWPHIIQIYPHIHISCDLRSTHQPTRPSSSPSIPDKPGLTDTQAKPNAFAFVFNQICCD